MMESSSNNSVSEKDDEFDFYDEDANFSLGRASEVKSSDVLLTKGNTEGTKKEDVLYNETQKLCHMLRCDYSFQIVIQEFNLQTGDFNKYMKFVTLVLVAIQHYWIVQTSAEQEEFRISLREWQFELVIHLFEIFSELAENDKMSQKPIIDVVREMGNIFPMKTSAGKTFLIFLLAFISLYNDKNGRCITGYKGKTFIIEPKNAFFQEIGIKMWTFAYSRIGAYLITSKELRDLDQDEVEHN